MPPNNEDRASLVDRKLPAMELSNGTAGSLTAPPLPIPHYLNTEGRAQYRFTVEGNAILTGGAGTLALEGARALLEHGLTGLALFDLKTSQATERIEKLREDFPQAKIVTKDVDVTKEQDVQVSVDEAAGALGGVHILGCFAGVVGCTHALDMTAAEWRRTIDINTTGAFFTAQAVARHMAKQGTGGSIVFIASISGHRVNFPQPQAAYNVSKSALINLKASLAAEWARYGIRTNSISPGYMDTILNEGVGLEEARNIWAARNPMGRMGVPQELTGPLVMLCSNAGTYINGADILVDGGGVVF